MKRLISVFLAMLLAIGAYSGTALAETDSVAFTFQMRFGEAAVQEMLGATDVLSDEEAAQVSSMVNVFLQLYESMQYRVQVQPDGIRVALLMQGQEIIDAAVTWNSDEVSLASSMMPGYRLVISIKELREAVKAVDWLSLCDALADTAEEWLRAQDAVTETGSFYGNAYAGGTSRVTYSLDDRNIATLLEGFLLCLEGRQDFTDMLNADALGGKDGATSFFHELRQMNYQVALNSSYHYTLALVRDADGELVGCSFNAFEGDALLGSLSLGMEGDALKGVVSVPLEDTVAYVDFLLSDTIIDYSARQAAAGTSYSAACLDDSTLRMRYESEIATQYESPLMPSKGMERTVTGKYTMYDGDEQITIDMEEKESLKASPFRYDDVMTEYLDGNMMGELKVHGEACEPFALAEDLKALDLLEMSLEEEAALEQAIDDGATDLMIKLFKYLPTNVIRPIMEVVTEITD